MVSELSPLSRIARAQAVRCGCDLRYVLTSPSSVRVMLSSVVGGVVRDAQAVVELHRRALLHLRERVLRAPHDVTRARHRATPHRHARRHATAAMATAAMATAAMATAAMATGHRRRARPAG